MLKKARQSNKLVGENVYINFRIVKKCFVFKLKEKIPKMLTPILKAFYLLALIVFIVESAPTESDEVDVQSDLPDKSGALITTLTFLWNAITGIFGWLFG